jgi:hypothetical protein
MAPQGIEEPQQISGSMRDHKRDKRDHKSIDGEVIFIQPNILTGLPHFAHFAVDEGFIGFYI